MIRPKVTPSLNFRWSDFVYGPPGICLPTCILMANKYWAKFEPDIEIPSELDEMNEKLNDIFYSKKGPSLEKLKKACGVINIKEIDGERWDVGVIIEFKCPESLDVLYTFFEETPPIPIILLYDHRFLIENRDGDLHAIIIERIDYEKGKIYVIDPVKKDLKEPFIYDIGRFTLAWKKGENSTFIVAPIGRLNILEGKEVKRWKQTTLGMV
jgi:hypothetical protein